MLTETDVFHISKNSNDIMKIFEGSSLSKYHSPVVGKIIDSKKITCFPSDEALIPVFSTIPQLFSIPENIVGIIITGNSNQKSHENINSPYPIFLIDSISDICYEKIAILDPTQALLVVSPNISVINSYKNFFNTISFQKYPIFSSHSKIRISTQCHSKDLSVTNDLKLSVEGLFINSNELFPCTYHTEQIFFEYYRNIAEHFAPLPITIFLKEYQDNKSTEYLRTNIKSIFRAAVYGNFSMMFGGILTKKDLDKYLETTHCAFCELQSEGLEFNGYISKGIIIDTPFMLSNPFPVKEIDFVCFDTERLYELICGSSPDNIYTIPEISKKIHNTIITSASYYHKKVKYIKLKSPSINSVTYDLLNACNCDEVFVSQKSTSK